MNLIIIPNEGVDCVFAILTEEGECLATHFCSCEGYAKGDLEAHRPERQKEWKERFGEYKVMFAEEAGITVKEMEERNKKWFESLPKEKQEEYT